LVEALLAFHRAQARLRGDRIACALGGFSNTYTLAGLPVLTTSTHFTDNVIRVGVNYRFGGPVVAKY
jgi:hypothetical protein